MKQKTNTQKGFISLITIIIISVVVVSTITTGVVLYKKGELSPLVANVSRLFTRPNNVIIEEEPNAKELQETELDTIEDKSLKQNEVFQAEQELKEVKEEAERIKQETERAKQEAEKAETEAERLRAEEEIRRLKVEAERIKVEQEEAKKLAEEQLRKAEEEALKKAQEEVRIKTEQELQRQLEAQQLAEEQRRQEELQRQEEVQRLAEEQQREQEELKKQLENLLVQELNNYYSQSNSLNSQILVKENEINLIIEEYSEEITKLENNPWLTSASLAGRKAKLIQERDGKLNPLYSELQSLQNQYSRLTGSPLTIYNPPPLQSRAPTYLRFQSNGSGGGILYDPSGATYLRVQPDGGGGYIFYGY